MIERDHFILDVILFPLFKLIEGLNFNSSLHAQTDKLPDMYGNPYVTKLSKFKPKGVKVQILHMEGHKRSKLQTQRCKSTELHMEGCKRSNLQTQGWQIKAVDGILSYYYKVQGQKYSIIDNLVIIAILLVHGNLCLLMSLHQATWPVS